MTCSGTIPFVVMIATATVRIYGLDRCSSIFYSLVFYTIIIYRTFLNNVKKKLSRVHEFLGQPSYLSFDSKMAFSALLW